MRDRTRPAVVKFGGAALADITAVGERLRSLQRSEGRVVAVVSARAGVTDRLLSAMSRRDDGPSVGRTLAALRRLHPGSGTAGDRHLAELGRALTRSTAGRTPDLGAVDRVLAFGERLAVDWAVPGLRGQGVGCVGVDSARLGLWTDGRHGAATIDLARSRVPVRAGLAPILARGEIPVVTGFFGRGERGEPVTLGRGGSDYSASALGAILGARFVELVKREASILSADPRLVPNARQVRRLTYAEAEELAEFGARVLHPMTVEPARRADVQLRVRSMQTPSEQTVVGSSAAGVGGVRAITASPVVQLFRLRFPGGRRRPGVLAEVCARLAASGVPVVQAFTSAAVVSLVVETGRRSVARGVLEGVVSARGAHLEPAVPVALLAAVGSGALGEMDRFPSGLLSAARGVSATRASVTLAVPASTRLRALRELHAALIERDPPTRRSMPSQRRAFPPMSARSGHSKRPAGQSGGRRGNS